MIQYGGEWRPLYYLISERFYLFNSYPLFRLSAKIKLKEGDGFRTNSAGAHSGSMPILGYVQL